MFIYFFILILWLVQDNHRHKVYTININRTSILIHVGRVDIALKINRYCTIRFKLFWYTWIWYKHIVIVGIFIWERNIIRRLDHSFHKQIFIAYNRNKIYASYICHYSFQNHGSLKPRSFVGRVFTCTHREINSLNLFIVNYHIFSKEIAVTFQILHL